MKNTQNKLTKQLEFVVKVKEKIHPNKSPIDEVANILNINYDAAYRRLNSKVPFTLDETVILAKHFHISLDRFITEKDNGCFVVCENQIDINSYTNIEVYLNGLMEQLVYLKNNPNIKLYYSTGELPAFFFFRNPSLLKLRIYLWYFYFNTNKLSNFIRYEELKINDFIIDVAKETHEIYHKFEVKEMWRNSALNDLLAQLNYFLRIRLISINEVEQIYEDIREEFKWLEDFLLCQIENSKSNFKLYRNEFFLNNDTLLIDRNGVKLFIYLHRILKYFVVKDQKTCDENEEYFYKQLNFSTEISGNNSIVRNEFFNYNYDLLTKSERLLENYKASESYL